MEQLKLFLWEGVLYGGMMGAYAKNITEARELILKECNYIPTDDLMEEPQVFEVEAGFICWGNG